MIDFKVVWPRRDSSVVLLHSRNPASQSIISRFFMVDSAQFGQGVDVVIDRFHVTSSLSKIQN